MFGTSSVRFLPFILSLLVPELALSQQSLTKEQTSRLAGAGRVYGYIKYFHPFLQYKDINWDSAFAANVEGIIKATNRNEYAAVMQRLLASLDDDLSTVTILPRSDSAYRVIAATHVVRDSILYISMNDAPVYAYGNPEDTYDRVQLALQNTGKVRGIIFDMRTPVNSPYIPEMPIGWTLDWITSYFKGDYLKPSRRNMGYVGLDWEAFFKVSRLYPAHGDAIKEVPLVFIVANEDQLPLLATVLQQQGKAAIVVEEGKQLVPGRSVRFDIGDSIIVKVRSDEVVTRDGFLLDVQPNATYSRNEPVAAALATAKNLLLAGFQKTTSPARYAPMPVERRSNYTDQGSYPSTGYRMLAAAKIFSTVKYFFAAKDLMDNDWDTAYRQTIAKFIEAGDSLQYRKAVAELYANIDDSHGFISRTSDGFSLRLNPVIQGRGNFIPPVLTRVIENRLVVTDIYDDSISRSIGIAKGDVILSVDGRNAMQLVDEARKYQSASTPASRNFYVSSFVLFGQQGQLHKLTIADAHGMIRDVSMPTFREFDGDFYSNDYVYRMFSQHPDTKVKMLAKDIGYANLTNRLTDADNDSIVRVLKNTKAIIFDMRGHPHGVVISVFRDIAASNAKTPGQRKILALAPTSENLLPDPLRSDEDIRITTVRDDSSHKGRWVYNGKTVVLTNESAQSAAEDIVAYLKDRGATIIGSPTAGALSAMANFEIPGNLTLWQSNLLLWPSNQISLLPSGKSFQRYGVQPDILVRPTIKGLQSGKDEVLERAIKFLRTGK